MPEVIRLMYRFAARAACTSSSRSGRGCMARGFEQYTQCSGQRCVTSAIKACGRKITPTITPAPRCAAQLSAPGTWTFQLLPAQYPRRQIRLPVHARYRRKCGSHRNAAICAAQDRSIARHLPGSATPNPGQDLRTAGIRARAAEWWWRSRGAVLGLESSGRRPAGLDIRVIQRVELCPEDVALGAQRRNDRLLLSAGGSLAGNPVEREIGIFGRLR